MAKRIASSAQSSQTPNQTSLTTSLFFIITISITILLFTIQPITACTAFIAGRNSTSLGYTINTHTDDCYDCDFRIAQIPSSSTLSAMNSTTSSQQQRPVLPQSFSYPRYVGEGRGSVFYKDYLDQAIYNWTETSPLGHIPQVNVTFSYIEGSYAISNEHGVALGESTCGGRWVAAPLFAGGKALFEIGELGKIALERSRTAREAIIVMGDLAVKHGFYTAEWGPDDQQEGGEAYTVTDPFEAWIFHIIPTPDGDSAVWVAQRVPDNHAAVVTNSFIIRHIPFPDELDNNYFMYSNNIYDIAIENKLWGPIDNNNDDDVDNNNNNNHHNSNNNNHRLDFKTVYGFAMTIYREPYVSRRQWRVLSTLAPSLNLQPTLTSFELPFSVRPDVLITLENVIELHRDHFEGTPFDTTVGIEAGPYGNPNRWDQYESSNDIPNESITTILQALYNKGQKDVALSSSIGQEQLIMSKFLPHHLSSKLGQDDDIFKLFPFAKKINFTNYHYDQQTQHQFETILQNLSISQSIYDNGSGSSGSDENQNNTVNGDVLNIDRSQGEPLDNSILGKGFFERTISLFRTSYSHITTLFPSHSSLVYKNSAYISLDPLYVPPFANIMLQFDNDLNKSQGGGISSTSSSRNKSFKNFKNSKNLIPQSFSTVLPVPQLYNNTYTPRTLAYVTYLSLHQPASSTYTPIFPALPPQLNQQFTQGSLWKYSQDSAWWKFSTVSNYANNYYRFIIRDINYTQQQHETALFKAIVDLNNNYNMCIQTAITTTTTGPFNTTDIATTTLNNDGNIETNNDDSIFDAFETFGGLGGSHNDGLNINLNQVLHDNVIENQNNGINGHYRNNILNTLRNAEITLLSQMNMKYNDTRGISTYIPFTSNIQLISDLNTTVLTQSGLENDIQPQQQQDQHDQQQQREKLFQCTATTLTTTHSQSHQISTQLLSTWTDLFHHILGRYHDGYRSDSPGAEVYTATPLFYPTFWLKLVRFWRLSLGDPAAGRGYEYLGGLSTGLFAINETSARRDRYYEIDQQFNPGQQCLSPRLYDGKGEPEIIANSYTDRLLLNNGYNLLRTSVSGMGGITRGNNNNNNDDGDSQYSRTNQDATNGSSSSSSATGNRSESQSVLVPQNGANTDGVNIYDFYNHRDSTDNTGNNVNSTDPVNQSSTRQLHKEQQEKHQEHQQQEQESITSFFQPSRDGTSDVIALYLCFTIVAVGLVLVGYLIGRSSLSPQLEQAKQHIKTLHVLLQANGVVSTSMSGAGVAGGGGDISGIASSSSIIPDIAALSGPLGGTTGQSPLTKASLNQQHFQHHPQQNYQSSSAVTLNNNNNNNNNNGHFGYNPYDTYQNSIEAGGGGGGQYLVTAGPGGSATHTAINTNGHLGQQHHQQQHNIQSQNRMMNQQNQQNNHNGDNKFWNDQQQLYMQQFHTNQYNGNNPNNGMGTAQFYQQHQPPPPQQQQQQQQPPQQFLYGNMNDNHNNQQQQPQQQQQQQQQNWNNQQPQQQHQHNNNQSNHHQNKNNKSHNHASNQILNNQHQLINNDHTHNNNNGIPTNPSPKNNTPNQTTQLTMNRSQSLSAFPHHGSGHSGGNGNVGAVATVHNNHNSPNKNNSPNPQKKTLPTAAPTKQHKKNRKLHTNSDDSDDSDSIEQEPLLG